MEVGKVVSWAKNAGDPVEKGETILVVESDKADMDVESFYSGTLAAVAGVAGAATAAGAAAGWGAVAAGAEAGEAGRLLRSDSALAFAASTSSGDSAIKAIAEPTGAESPASTTMAASVPL